MNVQDLENLTRMAKEVAQPTIDSCRLCVKILFVLLILSSTVNIYLFKKMTETDAAEFEIVQKIDDWINSNMNEPNVSVKR